MGESTLEQDIIEIYQNNVVDILSINQIAKLLGKKYPYINKKVSQLIEEGILNKIVIGRSHLCSLNLDNPKTIFLLSLVEIKNQSKIKTKDALLKDIAQLKYQTTIHTVLYFQKKIVFVIEDIKERRKILRVFPQALVVDKQQFFDMIVEDEDLLRNHTVLYGYERYYEFVNFEIEELKRRYSPLRY